MSDAKYGRLFTERDVQQLVNVARLEGAPTMVGEIIADWDRNGGLRRLTFAPDEPLFLLRGQDERARSALNAYLDECETDRDDMETPTGAFRQAVDEAVADFKAWQEANPERLKVPD
jgi:hypothetical protein